MDTVLDVAFVLAVVAFFKQQFGLEGRRVLAWAFGVCLVFAFAPLISAAFPIIAPYVQAFLYTCTLFLAAAGSYDLVVDVKTKRAK